MVTSSPRTRYYLAFALLAVLIVLLQWSAQAAPAPETSATQRALAYTRHLAQVLLPTAPNQPLRVVCSYAGLWIMTRP